MNTCARASGTNVSSPASQVPLLLHRSHVPAEKRVCMEAQPRKVFLREVLSACNPCPPPPKKKYNSGPEKNASGHIA